MPKDKLSKLETMEWEHNLDAVKDDVRDLMNEINEPAELRVNMARGICHLELTNDSHEYKGIPALIEGLTDIVKAQQKDQL